MFAILTESERAGFRLRGITDITRRFLPDGDIIYYVSAAHPESPRCASLLVHTLGLAANHIVPDGDFDLPDIRGLKVIDTFKFRRALLLYSVLTAAGQGSVESLGIKCSDPYFSLTCACIAKHVRNVAFYSPDIRITDNFRDRVFSLYGASAAALTDCADYAVVDFDSVCISVRGRTLPMSGLNYSGFLLDYIPANTDNCDFLAAVYGYTHFKEHVLSSSCCLWGEQKLTTVAILNYST